MERFGMTTATTSDAVLEMKKKRAERFGTSVKEVDQEKRKKRIERFGTQVNVDSTRQKKRFKKG